MSWIRAENLPEEETTCLLELIGFGTLILYDTVFRIQMSSQRTHKYIFLQEKNI